MIKSLPFSLAVAGVLLGSVAGAQSSSSVRGVQDALAAFYLTEGRKSFHCITTPEKEIPLSAVNDEFCDCPDGSDEPGTAACTYTIAMRGGAASFENTPMAGFRFQCTSRATSRAIFHSRVNDGICDCCDGSDEYDLGVSCPDTCAHEQERIEREEKERAAHREASLKARDALRAKAAEILRDGTEQVDVLNMELLKLNQELHLAQQELTPLETEENIKRDELRRKGDAEREEWMKGAEERKITREAERKRLAEEKHAKAREQFEAAVQEQVAGEEGGAPPAVLKCVGWRQTQHCNGEGQRDASHDTDCATEIRSDQSGFCECESEGDLESTFAYDCGHKPFRCENVCKHAGTDDAFEGHEHPPLEDEVPPTFDDGMGYRCPKTEEARAKHREIKARIDEKEREKAAVLDRLQGDFGPGHIFLALANECFEKDAGEYLYRLCPAKSVKQVRKAGGETLLGKFKGFAKQTYAAWGGKEDFHHMMFDNGDRCWNGVVRTTEVVIVCAPENKVVSVEEPSMCTYKMLFESPALCE